MEIKRFAAIDIGSNALRLNITDVVEYGTSTQFKKSSLIRVPLRLGEDVFVRGSISKEKAELLSDAVEGFKYLMKANRVVAFRACATSAMREASNGHEVAESIGRRTGIDIEIISAGEEAEKVFDNRMDEALDVRRAYLYVDVGGGSTEITILFRHKVVASESFPIGTVRVLGEQASLETWERMTSWVGEHTARFPKTRIIGSGGNINKISKLLPAKKGRIKRRELIGLLSRLRAHTYEERVRVLGLAPDRADVIIPAAEIFLRIMEVSHAGTVLVPTIGVSDGIIKDLYDTYTGRHSVVDWSDFKESMGEEQT